MMGANPQLLWSLANIPTEVMPTVPIIEAEIVGSRRMTAQNKAFFQVRLHGLVLIHGTGRRPGNR
jgi:hypothetical protein